MSYYQAHYQTPDSFSFKKQVEAERKRGIPGGGKCSIIKVGIRTMQTESLILRVISKILCLSLRQLPRIL